MDTVDTPSAENCVWSVGLRIANMLAHAGTEVVKGAKLDQAILKLAKGLGLSQKLLGRPEAHESHE